MTRRRCGGRLRLRESDACIHSWEYFADYHSVPLRKIAQPTDVARAAAFLASHRAAGHISGQCISVDGGMEGRIVWSEDEVRKSQATAVEPEMPSVNTTGEAEVFGTTT